MTPPENHSQLPFGWSWEKLVVWLLFGAAVYALRPVFSTLFMTYIMSYAAHRAVSFLCGSPFSANPGFRKLVLCVVYAATLGFGFLIAQSIAPRAIAQGKWLLGRMTEMNLDRMQDDLLARTIGRIEFARFKHSPEYKKAFDAWVEKNYRVNSFEAAKKIDEQIRKAFEQELLDEETRKTLEQLERSSELDTLYRQWVRANLAPRELASNADQRKRLGDEYDSSYVVVNGEQAFQQQKETPAYQERREAANLERVTTLLVAGGRERETAERSIAQARAKERIKAMPTEERRERFRVFYQQEVPRRFGGFQFTYEQLLLLETIKTEAEFKAKLGEAALDQSALEDKFQEWKELNLAKESRLSRVFGDLSQAARESLPTITGWLTTFINSALAFGFNAFVALMFSFMVVWEIPHAKRLLDRIEGTRAGWLYNEVGPGLQRLGIVIGTAFSAQFLIAVVNASLIFVALYWLGLPSPVFLALIALVCCLVPYVGIVLAAVPILFVALQTGTGLFFRTAFILFVIHELDAWLLSPAILGEFLRLSPMAIIFVLFIAQPLFGMWGLLLGVPVAVFLINDVLLRPIGSRTGVSASTAD